MKKNKIFRKIIQMTFVLFVIASAISTTQAADFWNQASKWYSGGSTNTYLDSSVIGEISDMVEVIGTGVIAIATVVLGIKYVLGSVTEKADVKESMITLLVACIFFFGWSNLRNILITDINVDPNTGAITGISGKTQLFIFSGQSQSLETALAQVFSIVILIAKVIAVIATVYMGVKYIFSGSEGKAKLKEKGVMYIIGIVLIFTTLNVLTFVSNSINQALK